MTSDVTERAGEDVLRVLLTSTSATDPSPSWLAVQPLHDTVIPPILETSPVDDQKPADSPPIRPPRPIHITALQIPLVYESVLEQVPLLHTHPPRQPDSPISPIDENDTPAYDFIFHIGVCGRGPLRMERLSHKTGYLMKDSLGQLAPVIPLRRTEEPDRPPEIDRRFDTQDPPPEAPLREKRGFGGPRYDNLPDDLQTEIDVSRLVHDLKRSGFEQIYTSMDAGHYLCDFIYFCSLAEARRHFKPYEKKRITQVLLLHCPPVNQPLSTQEVTEAIKRIIVWVCQDIESIDSALEQEAAQAEAAAATAPQATSEQ